MPGATEPPRKIVHVIRAAVGGAFRHVIDLARGQIARGHQVGIICDRTTGGMRAQTVLDGIAPDLVLGLTRLPIPREPSPLDPIAIARIARRLGAVAPDVVHGHGAKGGALARMAPAAGAIRVYTPHGGSLHYGTHTLQGLLYGALERLLMARTDLFLFESAFARDRFAATIGTPRGLVRVVHNGVSNSEFAPIIVQPDASDVAFVGELRVLKGADVLIDAIALLAAGGRNVTATLSGEGSDGDALRAQAARLGLGDSIRFAGFQSARTAFSLGRIVVVPSRAESLPYVIIEAAAAGRPVIATGVGGIPEIFGPQAARLIPPGDPVALAAAITSALDNPTAMHAATAVLGEHVRRHFSQTAMVEGVLAAYREALHNPL